MGSMVIGEREVVVGGREPAPVRPVPDFTFPETEPLTGPPAAVILAAGAGSRLRQNEDDPPKPLTELLGTIPLDRSIRGALSGDEGRLKTALELAAATEVGDWAAIEKHAETLKLQGLDISNAYFDALQWARSTVAEYHID